GGVSEGVNIEGLYSLGSMFHQPVAVFYTGPRITRLSQLAGRRIAIGTAGSGAHVLALALLKSNGIELGGRTVLFDLGGKDAADALTQGKADAVFLMGDSAAGQMMRSLMDTRGIRLFDFPQAEGYTRRFRYLNKLELPMGSIDLGRNIPARTLQLIAPTVELIARSNLHPALSDILIEAAREVHGRATLVQRAGEFPAPLEHEYRVSDDAIRYYKSGKSFAYKHLPFWVASLVDRALVLLLPIAVLLIPGLRIVPMLYRWRISSRIYRRYGELMALERVSFGQMTAEQRADLLKRLDEIEKRVINVKLPGSFADQVYVLRQHIQFVRSRILEVDGGPVGLVGLPRARSE
ncbi:MAG TPA: TAXI family TRAP transporter solute-binding subunit, partial [Myxococcaceae bacterium]|nr:TAXI family TRAP transporter solute-binding subunit [Myxococcaceae bacterium]